MPGSKKEKKKKLGKANSQWKEKKIDTGGEGKY